MYAYWLKNDTNVMGVTNKSLLIGFKAQSTRLNSRPIPFIRKTKLAYWVHWFWEEPSIISLLNGHLSALIREAFFIVHENECRDPELVSVQKIRVRRMFNSKWDIYNIPLPLWFKDCLGGGIERL